MKIITAAGYLILVLCVCFALPGQTAFAETVTPQMAESLEDPMAILDTMVDQYEVFRVQDLSAECILRDADIQNSGGVYVVTGLKSKEYDTGAISLCQPVDAYFSTYGRQYAVLVRFMSDEISALKFIAGNLYGRIMLDFDHGVYPAIDVQGDASGIPMLTQKWNHYVYMPGEWAYAFLSITDFGQRNCYIWAENRADEMNYHTSYSEYAGEGPLGFSIELGDDGEAVTVSDLWLISFERMKR